MPIYSVKGPDGRIYDVEGPAGASDEQVIAFLQQHLAEQPEQKPKEGVLAGLEKGAESTLSQLRSGIGSIFGSGDEAARAGLKRGEDINKRYADQVSWDKVKKAYEEKGLLPAAGEAISQVPAAVAEQLPNLGTSLGGARLGALAGSPFGPVGSIVGGGVGLVAPSLLQQLGGNVERQAAEGQQVNVGRAALAAAPQAALDVAGSFIPLGGKLVSKLTGLPVEALLGRTSAQAAKLAEERMLATVAKGTATGALAEIPTEVAQQMLERAQAGLSLTSPDALKEYGETAYQVSLLGPLGAVGRMSEVGGARQQVEKETALDMRQKRMEQLDQEEQNRVAQEAEAAQAAQRRQEQLNDPEFAMQAEARYTDLQQQFATLREQANAKIDPTDLAGVEAQKAAREAFKGFKKSDEYKSVMDDYQQTAGTRAQLKQQQEEQASAQAEATKQKGIQDELEAAKQKQNPVVGTQGYQERIPGLEPMETENVAPKPAEDLTARRSEFMQKQQELAQLMETHQQKESAAAAKGDIDAIDKLRPQRQMLLNEQEYIAKQLGEMGAEPAENSLDAIRAKIDKQKAQLQSLGGEGYDPVKADKIINTIRALEEKAKTAKPGQAGLDFGKATKEQVSETQPEFAARLTAAQAERRKALEEEYQQKIRPEIQGIQRIAGRKDEGPEMGIELPTRGGEAGPEGSAAMGQMQQTLRGAKPGEQGEFIYTAPEVVTTPPKLQKAPSEGYRLFARQGEPVRPATSEDISQRIASALAQPGLTDETYAFLRRAENVLPKTNNQGVLSLLDQQLAKIESGAEGRARAGAPKPTVLQGFPVGETAIGKRASDITKDTLRGPSAKAQPLSLQEEITPLLEARERGGAEAQAGQLGLFPEENKKLGYIKPDRAAFERFMRSPFVNKLRKVLRTDQKAIDRAKLDDLKVKIADLQAKATEMEKVRLDYSDAARTIQLNRDVGKQRRDINQIRAVITDRVLDRMELKGLLDGLPEYREQLIQEGRSLGESVELPLMRELNHVEEQLHELNTRSLEVNHILDTLESQLKVEAAKITLAKLNPKLVSKETLATAKQNLLDAQRAKGVIESAASKEMAKQTAEAGAARRTAQAIAEAKSVQERIDLSKENQERLEAMYGESSRGIEVPAISEAQRASREMGEPVLSQSEQADITKNPLKVLGGYRSSITTIEKRLSQAQRTSNEARMQDLQKLLEKRDKLDKQYKAAQFADQRSEILPELEAAENAYDDAASKLATEPLTWKGMAKDIRELSEYYIKAELLEDKINSGKVRLPEEKPPRVIVKPDAEQKKILAERRTLEQNAEAAKRANAPTTSGEALTRSEAQKAREPEKSTYTGKGIGQEGLSKHDEERLKPLLERKAAGAKLNAAEEAFIKAKTKVQPVGINVKPEKTKNINPAQELIDLVQKNAKPDPKDSAVYIQDGVGLDLKRAGPNAVHVALIKNYGERGAGKASTRLNDLLKAADDFGVTLSVTVEAVKAKRQGLSSSQLEQWYAKNGFKPSDIGMTRRPAGAPSKAKPVKYRTVEKTGPGLKINNIQEGVDRITKDWTIKPNIKIVATEKDLPGQIQEQAAQDEKTGRIPGLYDPSTRTVYLVAENLKDGDDVAFTLAHEIAGHFGLQQLLGRNYAETMDNLYNGNETVRKQADAKLRTEKNLDRNTAVEEVLAEMAEQGVSPDPDTRSALRKIIDAIKNWFAGNGFKVSDNEVKELVANARKYVMEGKRPNVESVSLGSGKILYRTNATYANADFAAAGRTTDKFVAKQKTFAEKVRAEGSGLTFETMLVDRFAGFERLKKLMEPLVGTQMMYYLRMYDQRMNFVSQAVGNGALKIIEKTRADGRVERVIEAGGGASIKNVVNILKQATPIVGNGEAVNRLFTMYMSAIRARDKGFAALHFGTDLTEADLKAAKATVDSYPEVKKTFEAARAEYNQYNKDMLNFLAQTGAISKQVAADLTKNNDYIPWYRERNGFAELVIGAESPIRIGNITEQPYLHELVGGERPILDFMTSSVQNTNMLTDMGLRNLSTKNAVIELANLNLAKITPKPIQGTDVVRFKIDGEDRYAIINTDDAGVPADILVKGMEGIPTQMPVAMRLMGMPATFLRKAVTASPLYAAKQLFRDSLAAPILVGADFMPVTGALRQLGKSTTKDALERRGITGGQIFTGTSEDLSRILHDIASDKVGWKQALGKLEAINMEADATTRRAQYNSYINQGLSEMEATLMSLESMNFNKRGASPSIHMANSLIPFFNAQIQSLNVLYKALTGKLPFNEKLKIQQKLLLRGGMLAAGTLAYAGMMQDDEAYKNATPEQKYGNWFIRVPGFDEPVRLPIPFEIGYLFKALPEAVYNSMVNEHGKEEAVKAFGGILKQLIPGGSSYGIPQAMRPAIEAGLGKSFYTGRDILSAHEKQLLPEDQFRENTSEVAKSVGRAAGISPIILDQLVQGYTGAMGLAFVQAVGTGITKREGPEAAVKRLSDMPVIGSAFQPNDAGAIISRVYDRMLEFKKVEKSVDDLFERGHKAEAMDLLNTRGNEYAMAEVADYYTSTIRELTSYENAIRASNMSPEEKRAQLTKLRQMKTQFAASIEKSTDKTIPR
jgi:hypothetical protein